MKSELLDAIDTKNVVELRYHGYARTVEPHAYGRDKNGDEILRCFQVSGGSERELSEFLCVRRFSELAIS